MMIFEDKQHRETERVTNNFERLTRNGRHKDYMIRKIHLILPSARSHIMLKGCLTAPGRLSAGRWTLIANRD